MYSFFDTTPVGRLINRFSRGECSFLTQKTHFDTLFVLVLMFFFADIYVIDEQLTTTLRTYSMTLFSVFSTLFVISSVTPM